MNRMLSAGVLIVSRKHWSDFFLILASVSLILAVVLTASGRVVCLLTIAPLLLGGLMARRRMI
jgi:hypothetical protein